MYIRPFFAPWPAFKCSTWRNGPSPWEISTFKGHDEVKLSNGSGFRDPRFEILRIDIYENWPYFCQRRVFPDSRG